MSIKILSISAVLSSLMWIDHSKYLSLFIISNFILLIDCWRRLTSTKVPIKRIAFDFILSLLSVGIVPILAIVLKQYNSINPDTLISIPFKSCLFPMRPTSKAVHWKTPLTIRHVSKKTAYLHTLSNFYLSGSHQQIVTLLDKDTSKWFMEPYRTNHDNEIKNGDIMLLRNEQTGRTLHSHDIAPPVSEKEHHREVSCYGNAWTRNDPVDQNDLWRIVFDSNSSLSSRTQFFRLEHYSQKCVLQTNYKNFSTNLVELTCGVGTLAGNALWVIEDNGVGEDSQYQCMSLFGRSLEIFNGLDWKNTANPSTLYPVFLSAALAHVWLMSEKYIMHEKVTNGRRKFIMILISLLSWTEIGLICGLVMIGSLFERIMRLMRLL